jgi:hypothetical protein
MESKPPDRLNMRVLLMLAIVGAVLGVIGWYRYFQ